MGWNSASRIFDPVCDGLIRRVREGLVGEAVASRILEDLIRALQEQDWDTEDESLDKYGDEPFVVRAFGRCGIRIWECSCGWVYVEGLNPDFEAQYRPLNAAKRPSWLP